MDGVSQELTLRSYEDYVNVFDALSHPMRMKILGMLAGGQQYVSELARALNISRPLLYMHLKKLEAAGLVDSHAEISATGKANKFYNARRFCIQLDTGLLRTLAQQIPLQEPPPKEP